LEKKNETRGVALMRKNFKAKSSRIKLEVIVARTCLRAFRTKMTKKYLRDSDGNVIRQRPSNNHM
jgi:hypothetical protein